MRICYFSTSTLPSTDANAVHVMRMAEAFAEREHEVTLVAAPGNQELADNVFEYFGVAERFSIAYCRRSSIRGIGSLVYGFRASRFGRKMQPNLFYGRCPHSLLFASLSAAPVIYEAHSLPRSRARLLLERLLFSRPAFARLVVISEALRRDYLNLFPALAPDSVVVAHDAATLPAGAAENSAYFATGKALGEPLDIGYVGSLFPGKGAEVVVELARSRLAHRFHIVGGRPKEVERLGAGAPENLRFHGRVPPSEVFAVTRSFDVLLLPIQTRVHAAGGDDIGRYTSPLKMFEYMATGRPMVASRVPVLQEVLSSGRNSLLAGPEDIGEWAGAIDLLAEDADLRKRLARCAFNDLKTNYTWVKRVDSVLAGSIASCEQ